jgi:hypothetical protein
MPAGYQMKVSSTLTALQNQRSSTMNYLDMHVYIGDGCSDLVREASEKIEPIEIHAWKLGFGFLRRRWGRSLAR